MFSKPNLINRNEQTNRKELRPGLGLTSSPPSGETFSTQPLPAPEKLVLDQEHSKPREALSGAHLVVGPGVKLKGAEILDCDTLIVEGSVEATMDSRVLRITEQGTFTGKVSIDNAEIHGRFEGELTARSQLVIHTTGRVSGKIRYGKLVIDEGGELCGDISTISAENHNAKPQYAETTPKLNAVGA